MLYSCASKFASLCALLLSIGYNIYLVCFLRVVLDALTCFNKLNSGFVYFSGLYGVIVNLWLLFCTF